jgi:lipopolysaccharide assembly outer membrane protein LptD (OstA)
MKYRIIIFSPIIILLMFIQSYVIADSTSGNPAEEIFGKNFKMTVDPTSGTLKYNISEKTNELESIIAEMDVKLVSDKLTLSCDKFVYDAKTKKLNAEGKRVEITQEGISAVCGKFIYDPEKGITELLKFPEIINKDEMGRETKTKGEKITIERLPNGDTMVMVEKKARLSSQQGSNATPKMKDAVEPAQKVFGKSFEIITGDKGEILYSFSAKNELISIVARNQVYISSDQIDLNCDRLEFYSTKNKLLAMGSPVKIFQKTLMAECGRFEFYPDEGRTLLLENPVILNKDEKGNSMETHGRKIEIIQEKEGRTTILIQGSPSIEASQAEKEEPEEEAEEDKVVQLTDSNLNQIKNFDIIQE